jgi:hypothetical protein
MIERFAGGWDVRRTLAHRVGDVFVELHARFRGVLKSLHAIVVARHVPDAFDLIEAMPILGLDAIAIGANLADDESSHVPTTSMVGIDGFAVEFSTVPAGGFAVPAVAPV